MREWAVNCVDRLASANLDGYIAKKGSPSCGMFDVDLFDQHCAHVGTSRGIFADELSKAFPQLPIEDEERLRDSNLREEFIERVSHHHGRRRDYPAK